jgi:hypothetical protein
LNLHNEIKVLQLFSYLLGEENRKLSVQMMAELDPKPLEAASLAKDPFDLVAMALILSAAKDD